MKLSRRTFLSLPLLLAVKPSWSAPSFPLPPGHFVPARMPMHPVFPRPDNETQPHARHRWAHPDFRYEIPIGIQGGAWPFKYEIIRAPSGASIGQNYWNPDYGVLKWTPVTGDSGIKHFTVRVTDQELNTIDLTWTTTVDPNQFIFINANAATSGSGTISSPLKTIKDWYKDDINDATYHNKIIVFRGGNYIADGGEAINNNIRLEATTKTPTLIGYPNETAVIDCSIAKFFTSQNLHDLFIANLRFEHAKKLVSNSHFFYGEKQYDRATWWKNYFFDAGPGTKGNDNPSGIYMNNPGSTHRTNILIKDNIFDRFNNGDLNGSYVDLYGTDYVLIEENKAKNSHTGYGLWAKVTKTFVTIRANNLSINNSGAGIVIHYGDAMPGQPHDHEVCWNKVINTNLSGDAYTFLVMGDEQSNINRNHYNTSIYRNTFAGSKIWIRGMSTIEPFKVDGNVIISDHPREFDGSNPYWNTSRMTTLIPNVLGKSSDNIIDSAGNLSAYSSEQYLGLVGHEISEFNRKAPKPPILQAS